MPLDGWPKQAGAERSARILAEVRRGNYQLEWCPMQLGALRVFVSCDALKIDGVRVSASAITQQLVADELQAVLLTPKLYDEIWLRTAPQNRLDPKPQPITSSTAGTIQYSSRVDTEVARKGARGLIANTGKAWVISSKIFTAAARAAKKAANHGWVIPSQGYQGLRGEPSQSTPSLLIVQDIGLAHDDRHDDYSQLILLARRAALYGQDPVDLSLVYTGKDPGTELVSHEGALPDWRQPGADDPRGGFPSSSGGKRSSIVGPIVGGAAAGVLAAAVGAGAPIVAGAALIGVILGKKASA